MQKKSSGVNKASSGRGRPQTPLIDRLRVVVWSHFVQQKSSLLAADERHKRLIEKCLEAPRRSGVWARYLRGEVLPQNARSTEEPSLIRRIEDAGIASESERIFSHPVWALMDFKKDLSPLDLKAASLKLDKRLLQLFILHHVGIRGGEVADKFWYRCPADKSKIMERSRLIHLDGLAVSIICARMSYLAQNRTEYLKFLSLACDFLKIYAEWPLFKAKRMKSVLLVIEGSIQEQVRAAIRTPRGDYDFSLDGADIVTELQLDWMQRTKVHKRKLSTTSLRIFKEWLHLAFGDVVESKQSRSSAQSANNAESETAI